MVVLSPLGLDPHQLTVSPFQEQSLLRCLEAPGNHSVTLFAGSHDPLCWPPRKFKISKAPNEPGAPSRTVALVLVPDAAAPLFQMLLLKTVILLHSGPPEGVKFPLQRQSPLNWKRVGPECQQEPCLSPKGVPGPLKLFTADCSPVLHFPLHSVH